MPQSATGTGNIADGQQYPLDSRAPRAMVAVQETRFSGATGSVATTFTLGNSLRMTATRVSTGLYRYTHPIANQLTVVGASVQGPTGTHLVASVKRPQDGRSGTFDVNITRPELAAISGGSAPVMPVNPPTGTALILTLFSTPFANPKTNY